MDTIPVMAAPITATSICSTFDSKTAKVDFRQLVEMMVDANPERLTAASATECIPAR